MRNVFERSANRGNGNNVAYCNASGNLNSNNANNGYFCAPDCVANAGYHGLPLEMTPATQSKESPSRGMCHEQHGGAYVPAARGSGTSGAPTFDDAFGVEALMEAAVKCLRGVTWKGTGAHAYLHVSELVSDLFRELHDGAYEMRQPCEFWVTSPKRRLISSIHLRDRIVQRSLNDNVIYPAMSRSWIYDNYACQLGKGTDFARERMRAHLERHSRRHGTQGWVLKVDVRGYYAHMLHSHVDARFSAKLPGWAAEFAHDALATQYGEVGYKPGSQMVQIAGIDYLDYVDHAVKERMGIRGYGRYMDDLVLVHHDRGRLESCLSEITRMLSGVGLSPHPKKTLIQPVTTPMEFLGFNYRVRDGGAVTMLVKASKPKEQRRRMRHMARLVGSGRMEEDDYLASVGCMRAHLEKGDSVTLPARQVAYGTSLIGG